MAAAPPGSVCTARPCQAGVTPFVDHLLPLLNFHLDDDFRSEPPRLVLIITQTTVAAGHRASPELSPRLSPSPTARGRWSSFKIEPEAGLLPDLLSSQIDQILIDLIGH